MDLFFTPHQRIRPPSLDDQAGFTLIELLIVMFIILILATYALVHSPTTTLNLTYQTRMVLDDIRFAQGLSLATGQRYRWVKESSTTYSVQNASGVRIRVPSGCTTCLLVSKISFGTLSNLPSSLLVFNSQGFPFVDTGIPGTSLSSIATINLTDGSSTRAVQILPGTGYSGMV